MTTTVVPAPSAPPATTGGFPTGLTLLTALAPMVWGTTYVVTTELLPEGRPLFAGLLRALPAGLVLLAVVRRLPEGVWWWRALVLGALNIGLFFPLLFIAAERHPAGEARSNRCWSSHSPSPCSASARPGRGSAGPPPAPSE